MSLYKLRPYQEKSIELLKDSFRKDLTRPVLELPTGSGKTVILAHIIARSLDKGKSVLFICPYNVLIEQTIKSFRSQGITSLGVIQASHPLTDSSKRLQIASVQTFIRRKKTDFDLILVDECQIQFQGFIDHIKTIDTPVIGVTATAYSSGMGITYNNLIQPITMKELIDNGSLCPYIVYGPSSPDMKGVKISKGDYAQGESGERMSTPKITGSITDNWLKHGNNSPTICFAVNVAHANHIGTAFTALGISNFVMTGNTPTEERQEIFKKYEAREVTILVSVGVLIAGFDSVVHTIIHARPTKSQIVWKQSFGRGLRVNDGKERLTVLDHAGNCERLGYPEDYHIYELDNGDKPEPTKRKKKEKDEKLPKKCPKCDYVKPIGEHECSICGFTPRITRDVEVVDGELVQISGKKRKPTMEEKAEFYGELIGYQQEMRFKNKNYSDGYIAHLYKTKFGCWPKGLKNTYSREPTESTRGFIKSRQIAFYHSKRKGRKST